MTVNSAQNPSPDLTKYGDLPLSWQFYKVDKDFQASQIKSLLGALKAKISGSHAGSMWQIERKAFTSSNSPGYTAHASSLVAEFEDEPTFLTASPIKERRYGYV